MLIILKASSLQTSLSRKSRILELDFEFELELDFELEFELDFELIFLGFFFM